jgi:hypothetical protein
MGHPDEFDETDTIVTEKGFDDAGLELDEDGKPKVTREQTEKAAADVLDRKALPYPPLY